MSIQKKFKILNLSIILFIIGFLFAFKNNSSYDSVAWWSFDKIEKNKVKDITGKVTDHIDGNFRLIKGIRGQAIKLDGYTTKITRKAKFAPKFQKSFTIEAWVALAAYPWNWCPIINQMKKEKAGYSLDIGPRGEVRLQVVVEGLLCNCIVEDSLPLRQWCHVVGVFDANYGLKVYVNGKEKKIFRIKGMMSPANDVDLILGSIREKKKPAFIHREHGTLPYWFSLDAALDEIKIYNKALNEEEISQIYETQKQTATPDIPLRVLPYGPKSPGRFGAYYTKLKYYWEWDDLWQVAEHPDIVVQFDNSPVRVIFWRGTRYSPAWVTDNNLWMADQSVEAWNNREGCYEHMQDRHCKYSHVRIIENSKARVVIHWRYAPVSAYDHLWNVNEHTGWALWVDEYYYIYPDLVSVRKVSWPKGSLGEPHQFQESIVLASPGQLQGDVINKDYVTIANLEGDTQTFEYIPNPPKRTTKSIPKDPLIQVHNLKSKFKPFIIFEEGSKMGYLKDMNILALSRPGSCSHWPVGQMPCDGRTQLTPDRATSFLGFPITDPIVHQNKTRKWWNALYGMTDRPISDLIILAKSWNKPPDLRIKTGDFIYEGYDKSQRTYILKSKTPRKHEAVECYINASKSSPLFNMCFLIKNWGDVQPVVKINGKIISKRKFRVGFIRNLNGVDDLVLWIFVRSEFPLSLVIEQENRN